MLFILLPGKFTPGWRSDRYISVPLHVACISITFNRTSVAGGVSDFPVSLETKILLYFGGSFHLICWCLGRKGRSIPLLYYLSQNVSTPSSQHIRLSQNPSPVLPPLATSLPWLPSGFHGFIWQLMTSTLNYLFYPCLQVHFNLWMLFHPFFQIIFCS